MATTADFQRLLGGRAMAAGRWLPTGRCWVVAFALLGGAARAPAAEPAAGPDAERTAFFEKRIRPVLVEHCQQCHAADAKILRGGLLVDSRDALRAGGESGQPGIVPGDPAASAVYTAISWTDPDLRMPPKGRLPDGVIADFRTWIEQGAADPREAGATAAAGRREIDIDAGREHWAFQRPVAAVPPAVRDEAWPKTAVDRFLLAALEKAGVRPVADADRATLARRLAFDLTGLPPTPEEVREFVADPSPAAVEAFVDRLLASPRFGERWARRWLDVARYAESNGKEFNAPHPHAWRYRDWCVESFRADKPYDEFLREQIAGDLLPHDGPRDQAGKIVATGFLAIGPKGLNAQNARQFHMDLVDEQIDVVSQSMLGLSLACARCHDHKFDPVTQRDYYALAGIFLSTETLYGTYPQQQNNHPSTLIELERQSGQPSAVAALSPADMERLRAEVRSLDESSAEVVARARDATRTGGGQPDAAAILRARFTRDRATGARSDLDLYREDGSPRTLVMGVLDRPQPRDAELLVRGEVNQPGDVVPRGLVEVLLLPGEPRKIATGSGRLDLAFWIASRDNPLTARVLVNRVWLALMGQGIVATPDNFGIMGLPPSHPELLDWLAVGFMEDGWSVKRLIRRIVMSRAYQLASTHDAAGHAVDPDNRLRWRMDERRLDAEAIRDAMLLVSGTLDERPLPGSPVARIREDRQGLVRLLGEARGTGSRARSIYLPIVRDQIPDGLAVFDFPDASLVCGQRDATNVPAQGLYLLNNSEVIGWAEAFARRIEALPGSDRERLAAAHELALGRRPRPEELAALENLLAELPGRVDTGIPAGSAAHRAEARRLALVACCQALFATAEFRHVE
jgi:cytochrome c553